MFHSQKSNNKSSAENKFSAEKSAALKAINKLNFSIQQQFS